MNKIVKIVYCFIFMVFAFNVYGEQCKIIYGTYNYYPPYESVDASGRYSGINIDLIKALAKHIDCQLVLESYDWNTLKGKLSNNELTIVSSSMDWQTLEYATPLPTIFVQYRIIIGNKDAEFIKDIKHLAGKKIAIFEDSIPYAYLKKQKINAEFMFVNSFEEVVNYIQNNVVDYAFIDYSPFEKISTYKELQIKSEPMFSTPYGFIIGKNNPLFNKINDGIMSLQQSGEYYNIIKKSKHTDFYNVMKIVVTIIVVILLILFVIALWNKTLYYTVKAKTKENQQYANLLQAILNHIPETIYIIDNHFNILWNNIEKKDGFNIKYIKDFFNGYIDNINDRCEVNIPDDDHSRNYHILLLKFNYNEAYNYLLVARDVTENLKLRDELFMTTRYSALGEMSTIIAHEINTPLASVMHNINFLEDYIQKTDDAETNEDIESAKNSIDYSIKRIQNIIGELKRYTNDYSREYTFVNIVQCCKNAVGITKFLINKSTNNFIFTLKIDENVLIYGNQSQIEQMIINILQNACYALDDYSKKIELIVEEKDTCIDIIFKDGGKGISQEIFKKICDPYFTTRKEKGGTGLGLSLCSRLIKEHEGQIKFESEEGKGTTVTLSFPKRDINDININNR